MEQELHARTRITTRIVSIGRKAGSAPPVAGLPGWPRTVLNHVNVDVGKTRVGSLVVTNKCAK